MTKSNIGNWQCKENNGIQVTSFGNPKVLISN